MTTGDLKSRQLEPVSRKTETCALPLVRAHAMQGLGILQSDQAEELDGSGRSNRKAPGQGTHPSLAARPHSTSTSPTVNI